MHGVFYIVYAAIAHFKGITNEYLVKSTGFWEIFVNEIEEVSFNIGFYILAIWRVFSSCSAVHCFRWLCRRCSSN